MIDRGHQWGIPAVFMRGGTSKALVFKHSDLPEDHEKLYRLFLSAMGSPDPHGRQLDGMGGGLSSLSKICIVAPSTREDADIDYTFVQIGIKDEAVDFDGACGNMTSAIGPFAIDEGLVKAPENGKAMVRIHGTNMGKIIHSHFEVRGGKSVISGDCEIIGVTPSGAGIRLDFIDPGNTKGYGLIPGGQEITQLHLPNGKKITASFVDSANPCLFVPASELAMTGTESPEEIEANTTVLEIFEECRRQASVQMGVAANSAQAGHIQSIPKIAMIARPTKYQTLSGKIIEPGAYDISVRMMSMGQAHRAIPVTGALCVATAARLARTTVADTLSTSGQEDIRIGTPSGVLEVNALVKNLASGKPLVKQASIWRTARRLMEGLVLVPKEKLER